MNQSFFLAVYKKFFFHYKCGAEKCIMLLLPENFASLFLLNHEIAVLGGQVSCNRKQEFFPVNNFSYKKLTSFSIEP